MNSDLAKLPSTIWSVHLPWPAHVSLIAANDLLLVATEQAHSPLDPTVLYAFSLDDGHCRWRRNFKYARISGITAHNNRILLALSSTDLLQGEGGVLALDVDSQKQWYWAPGAQHVSALTLSGDTVVFTVDTHTLIGLNATNGSVCGQTDLPCTASLSAPTVVSDHEELPVRVLVPCREPRLLSARLGGDLQWRFDARDRPEAWLDRTPIVVGETIFSVSSDGVVLALRLSDGTVRWSAEVGPLGQPLSSPVTDGRCLFVGARDGLHALSLDDGGAVWLFPTTRKITAMPVVCGEVLYVTSHDHYLYALDAASGRELWKHAAKRRIETSPVLADCAGQPCVVASDRGGTVTAIARPLSAVEHRAAGRWDKATAAYVDLGQMSRGAELLQLHGDPLRAAQLWEVAGESRNAAEQYEAAGAWSRAAQLWATLDQPLRQAQALAGYALSLQENGQDVAEQATAWQAASGIFDAEGKHAQAAKCRQKVAHCLAQPLLEVDAQYDCGLVLKRWTRLNLAVRNAGYGAARCLVIRASGEQFEGQVTHTQQIDTLREGQERTRLLDVRPLQHGDSVPLRLQVEYQDPDGALCACKQTLYLPVAPSEATQRAGQTVNVFSGGAYYQAELSGAGAVAQGAGAVAAGAGGVAAGGSIGGDVVVGSKSTVLGPPDRQSDAAGDSPGQLSATSPRSDLEQAIRSSYQLIHDYETIIRTSDRPEEKARAQRIIGEQWRLVQDYLAEYRSLPNDSIPVDIAEIAAILPSGGAALHAGDSRNTLPDIDLQQLRLDTAVPGRVYVGQPFDLAVSIRQLSSPKLMEKGLSRLGSGEVQVAWPKASELHNLFVRLRVDVSSPECEIHRQSSQTFRLYRAQDSPVFYFHLTPKQTGDVSIIVKVYQEDDWLGSARVHTLACERIVGDVELKVTSYAFSSRASE